MRETVEAESDFLPVTVTVGDLVYIKQGADGLIVSERENAPAFIAALEKVIAAQPSPSEKE